MTITFNQEPNYKSAFRTIAQGLMMLTTITSKHIVRHKVLVLLVFSLLINLTQFATIARQRIERDKDSVLLYNMTHQLDSINCTNYKLYRYK